MPTLPIYQMPIAAKQPIAAIKCVNCAAKCELPHG